MANISEPMVEPLNRREVDQTVASVFGLRGGDDDRSPRAMLEDYLGERNLLLILDN